jgi:SAM-dependent methyltransferase
LIKILKTRVPEGQRVLEIGCGGGELLAALKPSRGVGIDLSAKAIADARKAHPHEHLDYIEGDGTDPAVLAQVQGPFDAIVMVNVIAELKDVERALEALHPLCHAKTRILIYSYSRVWQPLLWLAEAVRFKSPMPPQAWMPPEEVKNMLALADWDVVRDDAQLLCPVWIPLLATILNRFVAHLPFFRGLSHLYGIIARPDPHRHTAHHASRPSTSVIIPCRNESGHIRPLVSRLPDLGPNSEFIFVEGNSKDDTEAVIKKVIEENPTRPFRFLKQTGKGKGDAVRLGFAHARGEVLVILDSDMGVAPEDVPKFVQALARGKGELVNGSRLVYPIEGRAMKFLNLLANKAFAALFSWLLGQQVRDTLCGTKALYREDYEKIAANRAFFGDFDPFGDFDIIFGSSRLNMRIVDLAIRYHDRTYGTTNISRFRHGWLLLRMSLFAARKLKFI